MGLIGKEFVDDDCLLGMWEIQETYDELFAQLNLTPEELIRVNHFKNEKRKIEWLSVRVLINNLLEREAWIVYNENRKPFLHDHSFNISITHSRDLTAVLLSKNKRVGIDLEYMSHDIEKVAGKFINEREYITNKEDLRNYHLYIHWCAKEALYKICDKQDINFMHNLTLKPFDAKESGIIDSIVHNRFGVEQYDINYYQYQNYIVAWCCK